MKHKRLSPVVIKNGTKRPEVIMLQDALKALGIANVGQSDGWAGSKTEIAIREYQVQEFGKGNDDGQIGRITWTRLLQDAEEAGWKAPLERRIHAVICFYENSTRQNAYGATSLLNDGAGVNYGVLQHNRHGSLYRVLRMGGRQDLASKYQKSDKFKRDPEIAHWMQTAKGVDAQNRFFAGVILKQANDIANEMLEITNYFKWDTLKPYWERFLLLLADSVTQNGALWSPTAKPFWKNITTQEKSYAKYRELHNGERFNALDIETSCVCCEETSKLTYDAWKKHWYGWEERVKGLHSEETSRLIRKTTNRKAMIDLVRRTPLAVHKLVIMAQWRSRSSAAKWWTPAVESRRMLDATGVGTVNGARLNLEDDFGFIDDDLFGLENPYEEV